MYLLIFQYDKHQKNYHSLNIGTVNKEKCRTLYIKEEERDMPELDLDTHQIN